ncbi:hypothetical protein STEG23_035671 [Scotinomys teguina]
MMENRNTPIRPENKEETPAVQSSPGLSSTEETDLEPTVSVSQDGLADAQEKDNRKQPVAPRGGKRELRHPGSSKERPGDLETQEQRPSARPGNQSSWATKEGPRGLQGDQEQVQPEGECLTAKEQPQPTMTTKVQLGRWQSTKAKEVHPTESCQGNMDHHPEKPCTLDSRGQPLEDDPLSEAGLSQGRLPTPSSGTHKDRPQEAVAPKPVGTAEEEKAPPILPSVPGPRTHKEGQEPEEHGLFKLYQNWEDRSEEHLTLKQEEAFRSYFEIFNGPGEVDAQSLKNILLLIGFTLTSKQVEEALMSADVNGDGHVDFKDFLAVMTDTKRFLCSVEQNVLMDMSPPNPYTLFFEILSLLVEMLALPEVALEEITNYYQKKLKEGTCKTQEMDSNVGGLRSRKKLPYNTQQQADSLEVPERGVLRILGRLKQNYAANLQSPYAQVPCIPLCPRLEKAVRRKQGSHNHPVLDQCVSTSLGPDLHGHLFQAGQQGSREHNSDSRKWLSSVAARIY